MGNCLVTKLKGTVDNDNLLKLGEFAYVTSLIRFRTADPVTGQYQPVNVRIMSGGTFPDGSKSYVYPGDFSNLVITEESKVAIEYKDNNIYHFLITDGGKLNFADVKYVTTLKVIELYNPSESSELIKGDLKDCAGHNWFSFAIVGQKYVTGDIANIKLEQSLLTTGVIDFRNTYNVDGNGIYGNIASVASPYLTKLNLWGASLGITGTLEELVAALRVDRPTGSILFNMTDTVNVTFNGEHYTGDSAHGSDGTDLVWTENTITWNGITVNA